MTREPHDCDLCTKAELRAEIERHMREKVELAGLVMKERDDNERLEEKLANRNYLREMQDAEIERLTTALRASEARNQIFETGRRLEADNERLRALLTDTVASMERGGFHTDLQKRIRAALKDTT